MYKHIVLWRLRDNANGKTREENRLEVKRQLESLPAVIKEIKQYEVGLNIGDYQASFFDVSLVSSFDDKEAFLRYTRYPEHDKVVGFIQSVQLNEEIVDYEH